MVYFTLNASFLCMRRLLGYIGVVCVAVALAVVVWRGGVGGVETSVYFSHGARTPVGEECTAVYAVQRATSGAASFEEDVRAAVTLLLAGPTVDEEAEGYRTNIPDGVQVRGVVTDAERAVVTIDFSAQLQAAGSCRVGAIRQQIVTTVAAVQERWGVESYTVVLTVDGGSPEEALQP